MVKSLTPNLTNPGFLTYSEPFQISKLGPPFLNQWFSSQGPSVPGIHSFCPSSSSHLREQHGSRRNAWNLIGYPFIDACFSWITKSSDIPKISGGFLCTLRGIQGKPLNSHRVIVLLEVRPFILVGIYFINNSRGLFFPGSLINNFIKNLYIVGL